MKIVEVEIYNLPGMPLDNSRRNKFVLGERDVARIELRDGVVLIVGADKTRALAVGAQNCRLVVDETAGAPAHAAAPTPTPTPAPAPAPAPTQAQPPPAPAPARQAPFASPRRGR